MDIDVLKVVGQTAGIGGIAICVVLLLFRDLLGKTLLQNLPPIQQFKLIRLIICFTFVIGVMGIGAWVYVETRPIQQIEESGVRLPVADTKSKPDIAQEIAPDGKGIIQSGDNSTATIH